MSTAITTFRCIVKTRSLHTLNSNDVDDDGVAHFDVEQDLNVKKYVGKLAKLDTLK